MPNNRLNKAFSRSKSLTSVFFTAGYPFLESTLPILELLQEQEIDFVEIGFPFSDPIADGNVIQHSNQVALKNGMNLEVLFSQLKGIRSKISLPLILMGYLNPVEQFGYDNFVEACKEAEIDGLILPDMPLDLFKSCYKKLLNDNNMHGILLASPTSSDQRIRELDQLSTSFLYAVSSTAVTGGAVSMDEARLEYFRRISELKLRSPISVGFGIDSKQAVAQVHQHARAAIIGSAFLGAMGEGEDYLKLAKDFLKGLLF